MLGQGGSVHAIRRRHDGGTVEVPASRRHAGRSLVSCGGGLNGAVVEGSIGTMHKDGEMSTPPPDIPGFPKDWRDQSKADLALLRRVAIGRRTRQCPSIRS